MMNLSEQNMMRKSGIYLALAGAAIIALYILYWILEAILNINMIVKIGIVLLVIGGILFIVSLIRERANDIKGESFRGTKQ